MLSTPLVCFDISYKLETSKSFDPQSAVLIFSSSGCLFQRDSQSTHSVFSQSSSPIKSELSVHEEEHEVRRLPAPADVTH